jgi:myo-inositol-1-phosphate synthase
MSSDRIKVAIVGLGNCASSLIQGIEFCKTYGEEKLTGLMNPSIAGYKPQDIDIVAAFDIDDRKIDRDVSIAIFSPPNCTKRFHDDIPPMNVKVMMGNVLDGVASHMADYDSEHSFVVSEKKSANKEEIIKVLKESGAEIMVNYLPVGSENATKFYMECALEAGLGVVNNIPVFIASDPIWEEKFKAKKLPIIGDDTKSQFGATIVHRVLTNLCKNRGVNILRTYQINTGGNTDFLNMLSRERLTSKKISKTKSVQSQLNKPLEKENIHIGPSDYIPWLKDNKVCFIRMEAEILGGVPIDLELRLSVEDSPNSAGVVLDAIRCIKLALDRGIGGAILAPSAYFCKHPPKQYTDAEAYALLQEFIHSYG